MDTRIPSEIAYNEKYFLSTLTNPTLTFTILSQFHFLSAWDPNQDPMINSLLPYHVTLKKQNQAIGPTILHKLTNISHTMLNYHGKY